MDENRRTIREEMRNLMMLEEFIKRFETIVGNIKSTKSSGSTSGSKEFEKKLSDFEEMLPKLKRLTGPSNNKYVDPKQFELNIDEPLRVNFVMAYMPPFGSTGSPEAHIEGYMCIMISTGIPEVHWVN